ncbi:MAG: HAD family hydrolase [Pseudomonadota bacterium]
MPLKLICFDLDNTLWPVDPVIRRAEQAAWQWLSVHAPDAAAHADVDRVRTLRLQLLEKRPDYIHNLTALRRDTLYEVLCAAGYGNAEAASLAGQGLAEFLAHRNRVEFFPGARELLERLAGRYRLAALSNGNASLQEIGLAHLFDSVLSAEKVGRAKPDPAMFLRALSDTGLRAQDAMHIGDHPEQDVLAARELGFVAVWANPLRLSRPDNLPPDVPSFEHFHQLETLIGNHP